MGVARPNGNSVVIGNSASLKWTGKYLKDDYGAYIMEEYTVTEWMEYTDEIKKEAVEANKYAKSANTIAFQIQSSIIKENK